MFLKSVKNLVLPSIPYFFAIYFVNFYYIKNSDKKREVGEIETFDQNVEP